MDVLSNSCQSASRMVQQARRIMSTLRLLQLNAARLINSIPPEDRHRPSPFPHSFSSNSADKLEVAHKSKARPLIVLLFRIFVLLLISLLLLMLLQRQLVPTVCFPAAFRFAEEPSSSDCLALYWQHRSFYSLILSLGHGQRWRGPDMLTHVITIAVTAVGNTAVAATMSGAYGAMAVSVHVTQRKMVHDPPGTFWSKLVKMCKKKRRKIAVCGQRTGSLEWINIDYVIYGLSLPSKK